MSRPPVKRVLPAPPGYGLPVPPARSVSSTPPAKAPTLPAPPEFDPYAPLDSQSNQHSGSASSPTAAPPTLADVGRLCALYTGIASASASASAEVPPSETEIAMTAKFEKLAETAATLNAASDALSRPIAELDGALKSLNIGVATWVDFNHYEDGMAWEWGRALGYAKVGGRWGLAIREYEGRVGEPFSKNEEWLFSDAPRSFRVEAVPALPKLIDALIVAGTKTAKALEAKVMSASEVAQAAQSVVRARKGNR